MIPLKSDPKAKRIVGFDVETYNNNKDLSCCSIYSDNKSEFFKSKQEFFNYLFNENSEISMYNSMIFCTNLKFDFFSVFDKGEAFKLFKIIERGSSLIMCLSYIDFKEKKFINPSEYKKIYALAKEEDKKNKTNIAQKINSRFRKITFCDTLNIMKASVKELGKIINIEKIELDPKLLGKLPKTEEEWQQMKEYNINDSKITYSFIKWFQNEINNIGGNLKVTIASISLDVFRRKYLNLWIKQSPKECINLEYKAMYGGRTEIYKRGLFYNLRTYDKTSLYPAMMRNNEFPFPSGFFANKIGSDDIKSYEGICYAELLCPKDLFPFLPVRNFKLIFPTGLIKGYYDFFSLRQAINLGYSLKKLKEGVIYKNRFKPFVHFVDDLFSLRERYKRENNPCHHVAKILMNSNFGKWGTRYDNKEIICTRDQVGETLNQGDSVFPYDLNFDLWKVKTSDQSVIPKYVHPIFSIYITAYARFEMYQEMKKIGFNHIYYIDTDGIKTDRVINCDGALGNFKFEDQYKELLLIKPKMYSYIADNNYTKVRIKGAKEKASDGRMLLTHAELKRAVAMGDKLGVKFQNFRSLRNAFIQKSYVNEIIDIVKEFKFADDKRKWDKDIMTLNPQNSIPLHYFEKDYLNMQKSIT